jgi:hypothetical protein
VAAAGSSNVKEARRAEGASVMTPGAFQIDPQDLAAVVPDRGDVSTIER